MRQHRETIRKYCETTQMKGKSYDDPRVISIWIIRDKIKSGIIKGRISPNRRYIN